MDAERARPRGVDADGTRFLDREAFYREAGTAYLLVRTGETRIYGNVLVRKGVVAGEGLT